MYGEMFHNVSLTHVTLSFASSVKFHACFFRLMYSLPVTVTLIALGTCCVVMFITVITVGLLTCGICSTWMLSESGNSFKV